MDSLNNQFTMIGARGISVFFASQDYGAGCQNTDCPAGAKECYEPDYPGGSPYLTAVGATTGGTPGKTPNIGESTVWFSGGGFSYHNPRPSYQNAAVNGFLVSQASKLPPNNTYNPNGRGIPDIAAQGENCLICVDGNYEPVDGTSCSTPIVSGIFSLLNDLRFQNNMAPLGFVNPLLYSLYASHSDSYFDCNDGSVTQGCGGTGPLKEGWYCVNGWDPATGVGSPNYATLSKYVLQTGQKTIKHWRGRL
jgi:tripeptidyl-peptidase-1